MLRGGCCYVVRDFQRTHTYTHKKSAVTAATRSTASTQPTCTDDSLASHVTETHNLFVRLCVSVYDTSPHQCRGITGEAIAAKKRTTCGLPLKTADDWRSTHIQVKVCPEFFFPELAFDRVVQCPPLMSLLLARNAFVISNRVVLRRLTLCSEAAAKPRTHGATSLLLSPNAGGGGVRPCGPVRGCDLEVQ